MAEPSHEASDLLGKLERVQEDYPAYFLDELAERVLDLEDYPAHIRHRKAVALLREAYHKGRRDKDRRPLGQAPGTGDQPMKTTRTAVDGETPVEITINGVAWTRKDALELAAKCKGGDIISLCEAARATSGAELTLKQAVDLGKFIAQCEKDGKRQAKRLVALLTPGDDDGVLDELVEEIKAGEARDINHGGFEAQVAYLVATLGPKKAKKAVREANFPTI
jgi:hypothetical protein